MIVFPYFVFRETDCFTEHAYFRVMLPIMKFFCQFLFFNALIQEDYNRKLYIHFCQFFLVKFLKFDIILRFCNKLVVWVVSREYAKINKNPTFFWSLANIFCLDQNLSHLSLFVVVMSKRPASGRVQRQLN